MYAASLLGAVGAIERRGHDLLDMRTLTTTEASASLYSVLSTLTDIAELLYSSRPFRLVEHTQSTQTTVRRILTEQYESTAASTEDFEPETLRAAQRTAGVVVRDSWLFVPLAPSDPAVKNWRVLFDVLDTQLTGILEDFRRIRQRLRASPSRHSPVTASETVVEMLEVLQDVLEQLVTTREYVRHRTDHDQTALLETIEQQADAFSGDTDA